MATLAAYWPLPLLAAIGILAAYSVTTSLRRAIQLARNIIKELDE